MVSLSLGSRCAYTLILLVALLGGTARGADGAFVSGIVVAPDGEPVEGAEVIVATPDRAAWPNLPPEKRDEWRRGAGTARTRAGGVFTIELPADAGLLSVHHPKHGYAEVKPSALDGEPKVKLEPWCRVEGVLKLGGKTAPAGFRVSLGNFGWGAQAARVHYGYPTTTDAQGRYVLDRVPAGLAQISVRPSDKASPVEQYVGADPEKPTRFDIGGAGRPVIGRLVLGEGLDLKDLNNHAKPDPLYSTSHFRRDLPWPSDSEPKGGGGTGQEREDAVRAWRKTPEAVAAYKDEYRSNLEFQPDGSFRLEDVPPGKYKLTLSLGRIGTEGSDSVGRLEMAVVVPESPAVPTDEPLDLGNLEIGGGGGGAEGL